MIHFIAGVLTGSVLTVAAMCLFRAGNIQGNETPENNAEQGGLNSTQEDAEERAKELKELQRQYSNMMAYTGKNQKRNGAEA